MLTKGELIAAAKRSSPLNNPLQEKSIINVFGDDKREKGVSKGGKGRIQTAEAILKCPHCGRACKIVFAFGKPPEWVRCTWCNELQPADGYGVIAYGVGLPRVLAPHEVKARAADLERIH